MLPYFLRVAHRFGGYNGRQTPDQPPPDPEPTYTAPTAPLYLENWGLTSNWVGLEWVASEPTDQLPVVGYIVFDGTNDIAYPTALRTSIFGLNPSTTYHFTVKGYTAQKVSAASNVLTVTTGGSAIADLVPPSAPTNVTLTPVGTSAFTLSWTAATDNVAVSAYLFRINGVGPYIVYAPATSVSLPGYAPQTTISVYMTTYDSSGNQSVNSNTATATTPAAVNYNRTLAMALTHPAPVLAGDINTATIPSTGVVVDAIAGTHAHGTTLTITGSGFGTKSPAAPVLWDNCSGTNTLALWDYAWQYPNFSSSDERYRTKAAAGRGIDPAHTNVSKYLCGSAFYTFPVNNGNGSNVMVTKYFTKGTHFYLSHYNRLDPLWPTFGDNNCKGFCYTGASSGSPYGPAHYYFDFTNTGNGNPWPTFRSWNASGSGDIDDSHESSQDFARDVRTTWGKTEFIAKTSSGSDGTFEIFEDCVRKDTCPGYNDQFSGTSRGLTVGGYNRCYGDDVNSTNGWRFWNDIYMDNTLARVMIGNNITYTSCTVREPQPPTAWASGSINVTVNKGALGATGYVFVFDSTGAVNPVGRLITF